MSRNTIEDLLDRYLKKETTPLENEQVEQWLAANHQDHNQWHSFNKETRAEWLDDLFTDIKTSISADTTPVVPLKAKNNWWLKVASIAAVIAIAFGLFWQWPTIKNQFGNDLETLQVAANQKRSIILSDGSKIWINASSELRYPKTFAGNKREVYLSGEAYFDIQHDSSKPFIVHTGKVKTTVLGTAFDIKANPQSGTVTVTVTRGKVSVADENRLLGYVTPGRQINYDINKQEHVEGTADLDKVLDWQDAEIRFDEITFATAIKDLQERFKVRITFDNENLANCRFTGVSLKGKNIDQILKVICTVNNATYQRNKNGNIIIYGKGCNQTQ